MLPYIPTAPASLRWSVESGSGISSTARGRVCYGAYLRFFELAETELFRTLGLTVPVMLERHGLWLVRRRVECDNHVPMGLDEELEVDGVVARIGRTSVELRFRVRRTAASVRAVDARYVLVAVDRHMLRPVPVPDELRHALGRAVTAREAA